MSYIPRPYRPLSRAKRYSIYAGAVCLLLALLSGGVLIQTETTLEKNIKEQFDERHPLKPEQKATELNDWSYEGYVATYGGGPQLIVNHSAEYPYKVLLKDVGQDKSVDSDPNNDIDVWGAKRLDGEWTKLVDDLQVDFDGDGEQDDATRGVFDAGTRVNGTYYFTGGAGEGPIDSQLYVGDSIHNLTLVGDLGLDQNSVELAYVDGTWHAFYETNATDTPCCSSSSIGHSTAPSPTGPWQDAGEVINTGYPDGYGVGDPEFLQVGDTYYLFYDHDIDHPQYFVEVQKTTDPTLQNWTNVGVITDDYAADADVRYDPKTRRLLMVNEYENGTIDKAIGWRLGPKVGEYTFNPEDQQKALTNTTTSSG